MNSSRFNLGRSFSLVGFYSHGWLISCGFWLVAVVAAHSQTANKGQWAVEGYSLYRTNTTARLTQSQGYNWITLAGQPGLPGVTDGSDYDARFNSPLCVVSGVGDHCCVGDGNNKTVRKLAL